MTLRVHDTLTRAKREFAPVTPGRVGMYCCGMTVQNKPHVGHIRAALAGDLMRRYLLHLGYEVTFVYNFTDVDDRIIERATEEKIDWHEVSERNIRAFLRAAELHHILPATHYPRATGHIPEILAMIATLIERGVAYAAGGDVYFEVRKLPGYGKLSGRNPDEMRAGARIEVGEAKRDPLDFALWKGAKPGEPAWDSPWGPGRPGWHIECSAMSMKYLGKHFDIHGGGQDLIFPHHENEIAQSEAATGEPFANFWCENGLVNLSGEKMSKSTGNFFFIDDLVARVDPEVVRYYLLSTHYRSPIEFSEQRLEEAGIAHQRLLQTLERAGAWEDGVGGTAGGAIGERARATEALFAASMDDDFNSARAIGHLFDLARDINRALDEGAGPDGRGAARALLRLGRVLGLFTHAPAGDRWDDEILALANERETARRQKDWGRADQLRRTLADRGVIVEDAPGGFKLKRK